MNNTPLVLNETAVLELLPKVDALETMRQLFTELGRNQAIQPPQTLAVFPFGR